MEVMTANGKWRRKERVASPYVEDLAASALLALKLISLLLIDPHAFHLKISTSMFLTVIHIILMICLTSKDTQELDMMC